VKRIVVGVDGSAGARHALIWAVEEAARRGAKVEVVHAWHHPYVPGGPLAPIPLPASDSVESDARRVLDHAIASVDASRLADPIEEISVCGGAAATLLDVAKGADLLVVGSRGRGGFTGLLLGSVSQQVAAHATCPVVIVPSGRSDHEFARPAQPQEAEA
jgi:nucleotide-binding universal stress UspA family protein